VVKFFLEGMLRKHPRRRSEDDNHDPGGAGGIAGGAGTAAATKSRGTISRPAETQSGTQTRGGRAANHAALVDEDDDEVDIDNLSSSSGRPASPAGDALAERQARLQRAQRLLNRQHANLGTTISPTTTTHTAASRPSPLRFDDGRESPVLGTYGA
jgi:hypothetical protein